MELRDSVRPASPAGLPGPPDPSAAREPVTSVRYRVDGRFTAFKVTVTVVLVIVAVLPGDRQRLVLAGVAALVLAAYALRDLIAPVRLAADREAVTIITGYAKRVRLPWTEIERVRVDRLSRFGLRSEFLELDAGESLHLLSAYDLGVPPAEVFATLSDLTGGLPGESPVPDVDLPVEPDL